MLPTTIALTQAASTTFNAIKLSTMTTDGLSAAKLAIYLVLLQPALFCLWKHGKTGFLGWLFVQAFCVLRIVTGGIGLHGSQKGEAALILGSIGLSPLLLAISGILYEACVYTLDLI